VNSGGDAAAWAAGAGVRAGAASLRGSNLQECMRTGCCEGSDLAFCFSPGRRLVFWRLLLFPGAGMGLVAQLQVARLCCWFAGHAGCCREWFSWFDSKKTTLL